MKMIQKCYTASRYHGAHGDLPILFVSGSEDPCKGGEAGWKDAVDFVKNLGYSKVQARLFDGMRHEILNETDHEKVYQVILDHLKEA